MLSRLPAFIFHVTPYSLFCFSSLLSHVHCHTTSPPAHSTSPLTYMHSPHLFTLTHFNLRFKEGPRIAQFININDLSHLEPCSRTTMHGEFLHLGLNSLSNGLMKSNGLWAIYIIGYLKQNLNNQPKLLNGPWSNFMFTWPKIQNFQINPLNAQ